MFDLFYTFLSLLLYIVFLPFLILFSFKRKYRESIPSRFFLNNNPPFKDHDLWFHVCSLGETKAIGPVVEKLCNQSCAISVITHTGFEAAKKYDAQVRYLPYEFWLWFWIRNPKKLVVLEAEFWYLLFSVTFLKGAQVIALNARISEKSFPKYYRLKWFYSRLFARCEKIFCQSTEDMVRFIALGAKNVEVVGNIKLAQKVEKSQTYTKPSGTLIVAGSTHEGEEEAILDGFLEYLKTDPDSKLAIVPRHPERFDAVANVIRKKAPNVDLVRWSEEKSLDHPIILIDAMGELNNIYAVSDIAILGGAFKPIGGHNPLEPATFGCKIITGKNFFLQKELFKYVSHVQFVEDNEIAKALKNAQNLPPSSINGEVDLDRVIAYLSEN